MLNRIKKNNQGFTIIEVMIVLAIAGLIILIVLLAIPALQRNSRNTSIKSDAGAVAGAISEFSSNNDGAIPSATDSGCTTPVTGTLTLAKTGKTSSSPKIQGSTKVTCLDNSVAVVTPKAGELTVIFGTKCPTSVTGMTVTPVVSSRSTAIIYANENSTANLQAQCIDS